MNALPDAVLPTGVAVADGASQLTLARPGVGLVVMTTTGGATGIRWVEAGMLLIMAQCTAQLPTNNDRPPNAKRGEAEKPARSQDKRTKCLQTTTLPCGRARGSERDSTCPPA